MTAVWSDTCVEEGNLAVAISALRKALGDNEHGLEYIQTVAKHGYRFVADIREVVQPEPESSSLSATVSPLPSAVPFWRSRLSSVIIVSLVLTALAISGAVVGPSKSSGAPQGIHSLAVLPFEAANPDPAYEYLKLGLADAIITRLANTGQIIVRPTSAVLKYADSRPDPRVAGADQKVDAIVAGHIETSSGRIRVTAQLVRVGDGSLLWADSFEKDPDQVFGLEDEVAERIAQSLSIPRRGTEKKLPPRTQTENSKAYQLYLQGRYFWYKRTERGLLRSIEYFQEATKEDPQYALAFAGLADSYVLLDSNSVEPTSQAFPAAKAAALKALQLDSSLSEAHTSLGVVYFYYEWNWTGAEQEFKRAIVLNPNYALAHSWYAMNLAAMGRYDEALSEARRAHELDPVSGEVNTVIGRVFYYSHQYAWSIDSYRKVIDLDPQFTRAHIRLGQAYAAQQAYGDSIVEFEKAQQLASAPNSYSEGLLGYAQGLSGNTRKAREICKKLTQRSRIQYVPAFSIALVYLGLGERDHALEWLNKAYQDHSAYMVFAKTDPLLDPLRSDPRFVALLHRMKFL
jgi:TolB-like protein/Flp pilus assembly protein TadD